MHKINKWRVLRSPHGEPFLAGLCVDHPTIEDGPIITNEVTPEQCIEGAVVISKSGTESLSEKDIEKLGGILDRVIRGEYNSRCEAAWRLDHL